MKTPSRKLIKLRTNTKVRISKERARSVRPSARRPHIFGRGARDRVLTSLAVNGPMHVRQLARVIGSDPHKVYDMVERLLLTGLIVKRDEVGFRKVVALNKGLGNLYHKLRKFLLALDAIWPVARLTDRIQPRLRWTGTGEMPIERTDLIFESYGRSRILLYVAAVGNTNMSDMYLTLGIGSVSALYVVNHWEREGIIRSTTLGVHRIIELDPNFPAHKTLRALLQSLIFRDDNYRAYRVLAREKQPYRAGSNTLK